MINANQPTHPGEYQFTADWFTRHTPTWIQILEKEKPRKILEIGSFEGRSASWLIEHATQAAGEEIELVCVDTWGGGAEHKADGELPTAMPEVERRFDHNIEVARAKAPHNSVVAKFKGLSSNALAHLMASGKTRHFDLIYIDGSHQAPDVLTDAVMAFCLLKVGGVMIFDDYLWSLDPPETLDVLKMPKPAIDAFLNIFQRKMRLYFGAPLIQLYARKLAD